MKKENRKYIFPDWDSRGKFNVFESSCLWFEVDPRDIDSVSEETRLKIYELEDRLISNIKEGKLKSSIISLWNSNDFTNYLVYALPPSNLKYTYTITRTELKHFAIDNGDKPLFLFPEEKIKRLKQKQKTSIFSCDAGTKWEVITITLIADDTVKIKTPQGEEKFTYHELKLSDKRKGDSPTVLWELLKLFCKNKGFVTSKNSEYNPSLSDNAKRLNKHLQKLFGIKDRIYTGHYKKEKGYKVKFICYDQTYQHTPVIKKSINNISPECYEDTELDPSQNRPHY